MAFTKITVADLTGKGVVGLPDTPGLSTTEMQEKFDEIANDVLVPKHNGLIDEIEASTAAASIGAKDANGNDSTVQAELNYIKQGGYTKAETDVLLSNKVDTEVGKGLSTFDFTGAYKDKLNGIEDNANNYVLPKGTQSEIGGVMGDGTTFTIDSNGVGHAVGGGGGGTADYSALINKPSINHVELIGDKDGSEFGFLSPIITITSDAGSTVKIKKGTTEIAATQKTSTTWEAIPSSYGTWEVISTLSGADEATGTVTVDAVKKYATTVQHITATITVTYPAGATYCKCSKGSTTYTATSNPQTFTVRSLGTWTIETELDGIKKTATATISADGDSESVTIEYASIEVTYDNNFRGQTITCSNGTLIYNKTAPSVANKVTFTIPTLDTWTVSAYASGDTYTRSVSVVAYTTYQTSLAVFNATITVTFPASNGATCTCDGVTATTSPYTFNIGAAGTYTATCTLDGVSKTQSFTITTDGQTESHTFEYGTINLTFDNEFRGQTITATDGISTITKTAPISGNTMVLYPNATGTWVISSTYSGTPYQTSATVTSLSTPVSAILQTIPDGKTVTPTDSIQKWLQCATINDKSYTTLNEVLADTDTFTVLLQDSNACDYMARSTTWATTICADADAMRRVGMYDYCSNALLGDTTWLNAIGNSAYIESVLDLKIPTLSSNTNANYNLSNSSHLSSNDNYTAYRAFDGNDNTHASFDNTGSGAQTYTDRYIQLDLTIPMNIRSIYLYDYVNPSDTTCRATKVKLSGYDGSDWVDIQTISTPTSTDKHYIGILNEDTYSKYRFYVLEGYVTDPSVAGISYNTMQFYGRHATQTNIIHSAASDTLYYIDGTNQTIGTTDTSGVGTVNWSNVPVGTMTIYSTVANDPTDLTSAYSKTVRITPHTTEVYCMPDNVLYWWGYMDSDCEEINAANGWSSPYGLNPPTYNTNSINADISAWGLSGIAKKTLVTSANSINSIAKGVRINGDNKYGYTGGASTKSIGQGSGAWIGGSNAELTSTSITKLVRNAVGYSNFYPAVWASNSACDIYALWYE